MVVSSNESEVSCEMEKTGAIDEVGETNTSIIQLNSRTTAIPTAIPENMVYLDRCGSLNLIHDGLV